MPVCVYMVKLVLYFFEMKVEKKIDGRNGTRVFQALSSLVGDIPRNRIAGAIIITDGQIHDVPKDMKVLKVLGVLNSDWKQEWGGGFTWNGKTYYAKPGSFYLFDPRVPHRADDILCDEKRIAIDYTVKAITYHQQTKTSEIKI